MKTLINISIQRKFLAIMLVALIGVNGPLLAIFSIVSKNTIELEVRAKKRAILEANSKALSKPLWDYDFANLAKVAETIALDSDIALVEIFNDDNALVASAPRGADVLKAKRQDKADVQHKEIFRQADGKPVRVGALRIVYQADRIDAAVWSSVGKSAILFVASTIAVLLAALFTNRIMIVRPLSQLTMAIEATKRLGKRRRVKWKAPDEIGQVVFNFNEMQDRLELEEEQLRDAHKRLSNFYNNTPVMLYSVNSDNVIVGVSDYWLRATGYNYDEVIGRDFQEFVCESSRAEFAAKQCLCELTAGMTSEFYCKFAKKDGSIIDVMISETADSDGADKTTRSLSVMTDITALKNAETEIRRRANTDILTGLANRAGFSIDSEAAIQRAEAAQDRLAVLYFDLDRFKWVNDNLGHHAGDEVLKTVAGRISSLLRPGDLFARLGGDEFAILLEGAGVEYRAIEMARRISSVLNQPFEIEKRTLNLTISLGISYYPNNATTADGLLKASDVAMYKQKSEGRNGYCLFDADMGREASRNLEIEAAILDGLREDWFDLHFQPIIDFQSGKCLGFEGLLRLNHPTEGMLAPAEVIAVAEQTGSIHDIGDRVLDLGLAGLETLSQHPEFANAYLSINLSGAQFLPSLPTKLASLLMDRNIRPDRLILEITESVLMQQNPELESIFQNIRTLGSRFALDDFGTGYSSLSYLSRFPVDIIKIDRSFVQSMDAVQDGASAEKARALVQGVVSLAHQMDLFVVAEGIESEAQFAGLQTLGIEAGQGFYFGKPEPMEHYLSPETTGPLPLRLVSG